MDVYRYANSPSVLLTYWLWTVRVMSLASTSQILRFGDLTRVVSRRFPILGKVRSPSLAHPCCGVDLMLHSHLTSVDPTSLWVPSFDSRWSSALCFWLLRPYVWLEMPLGPSLAWALRNGSSCDGSLDGTLSNSLPNSLFQASTTITSGPQCSRQWRT